mgnify:CR=1 FL=1
MVYDEEMLESFYGSYLEKIKRAKMALGRPLTLAEKFCMLTFTMKTS